MGQRLTLVLGSDAPDRLHSAAQLVAGAATAGLETHVFLVHAGLAAFARSAVDQPVPVPVGNAPAERVARRLADPEVPGWAEVMREAKEIGDVHVHACASSLLLLGLALEDLDPMVDDAMGMATFIELYDGSRAMYV
jgi:peroxiredoxin family protein